MKIRCPKCGSDNVVYWTETFLEKHYKIKKDGNLFKKPFKVFGVEEIQNEGYECQDLFCLYHSNDEEQWKKEEVQDE